MLRFLKLFLLSPISFIPLACATNQSVMLHMTYSNPNSKEASIQKPSQKCAVYVGSIIDARANKETVGVLGENRTVISENVDDWVRQGLMNLEAYEIDRSQGNLQSDNKSPSRSFDVTINRVFITTNSVRLHSVVVLGFKFPFQNKESIERTYRGDGDKMNWFEKESEIMDVFNEALREIIMNFSNDLKGNCLEVKKF